MLLLQSLGGLLHQLDSVDVFDAQRVARLIRQNQKRGVTSDVAHAASRVSKALDSHAPESNASVIVSELARLEAAIRRSATETGEK